MWSAEKHSAALDRVLELAILINDDMTRSLERDGLTPTRAHLLWELHRLGPSTQRVLAEALDVSPRNITGLVDALVATGFVTREPHPTDRRATLVSFTEHGARTAKALDVGREQLAELLFAGMSDEQFDGFVTGLDAVLATIRDELSKLKEGTSVRSVSALVRRVVTFELGLYRSLFRWVTRRPDVPSDAVAFGYIGAVAALLWAFIFGSATELVVLHLLLPWETVRIVVDVLGIWGLAWMLGMMASFRVHPHLVSDSGLRIRHGATTDMAVRWDDIATIRVRERSRDKSRAVQLDKAEGIAVLNVVIASRTNVDITLRRPLVVPLRTGEESITEFRCYVDDARELVRRARGYLASRSEPIDEPLRGGLR